MKENICLALGFFDSVHYGHRVIIEKLISHANSLGIKPVISTFLDSFCKADANQPNKDGNQLNKDDANQLNKDDNQPNKDANQLNKDANQPNKAGDIQIDKLIYTFEERKRIFSSLGVSEVLAFDFNRAFKSMSAENFLIGLEQQYNLRYVVCGYDYRFGRGGEGDVELLRKFCAARGIEIEVVDKVCFFKERVSSSRIKRLLLNGDITEANRLLVDNYFISGKVVRGRGEGRLNNIPTANLQLSDCKLVPKSGVYATKTLILDRLFDSVTNVGAKPSYNDFTHSYETFIGGFEGDIYDEQISVIFYDRIRDIKRFMTKQELANQIAQDFKLSTKAK